VSECFHAVEVGSGDDIFASFSDIQNVCNVLHLFVNVKENLNLLYNMLTQ